MNQGYIQIYTGNGKGKTTALLGLLLRAVGAGKRVYLGQFLKNGFYSEIKALKEYLPMVTWEQFGAGEGFVEKGKLKELDISAAKQGYQKVMSVLKSEGYDMIMLDEINVAVYLGLIEEEDVLSLMHLKPGNTELILTGRYASKLMMEKADLVTEMKDVKHYFNLGVEARKGIEW